MLYRFKSRTVADLIMLEPHARQVLDAIGKAPGPQGIITVTQLPAAIAALQAAVQDEAQALAALPPPEDELEAQQRADAVHLRQRAAPFLDMLERSLAHEHDVVWGV